MRRLPAILGLLLLAATASAFIVIDDTHDQTVGGQKVHVFPDINQVTWGDLQANAAVDGQFQYCTDCQRNTEPCQGGGSGAMALRRAGIWECLPGGGTCEIVVSTPTPLAFGTPGNIVAFGDPELQQYPGAACQDTTYAITALGPGGVPTCVAISGAVNTPTPMPTDTPLIDLLYSGKLNLGANASGTPLGLVAITANATPAAHDRIIKCAPPNATPVSYTMPAATGSGRVIDMINTTGSGNCSMTRQGGDVLNDQTADTLANKWDADTCYDIGSAQWACRNLPTPTPTP